MKTLKKINFGRVLIFLGLYVFLGFILGIIAGAVTGLLAFITRNNQSSSTLIAILPLFTCFAAFLSPTVCYVLVHLFSLIKSKIFKFTVTEKFIAIVLIPIILDLILFILLYREFAIDPGVFDNQDGPPIGLLFWLALMVTIPILQTFTFALGEIVVHIIRKIRSMSF